MSSSGSEPVAEPDPTRSTAEDATGADWGTALTQYRERLRRLVGFRLDRRLQARIDASDVIQETFAEATARRDEYQRQPQLDLYLWLRYLACQKLVTLHRHHLGREMRDAAREVSIEQGPPADDTSAAIAARLLADDTAPPDAAARSERRRQLLKALSQIDPIDREVLALRHFEGLSNSETAQAMGMATSAASKRYVRALEKLRAVLTGLGGDGGQP